MAQYKGAKEGQSTYWTGWHAEPALVERLKNQDPVAWTEFAELSGQLIHTLATKGGCTRDEAQEVRQETLISVAKEIAHFDTDPRRGSFEVWLLTITRRRIVDQLRKRPPPGRFEDLGGVGGGAASVSGKSEPAADLSSVWEEEWREVLLQRAVEKIQTQVNPAHFQIFYLAVVKEKSVNEVAQSLKVTAAQVYLVKHRLSALLKRELRKPQDL